MTEQDYPMWCIVGPDGKLWDDFDLFLEEDDAAEFMCGAHGGDWDYWKAQGYRVRRCRIELEPESADEAEAQK